MTDNHDPSTDESTTIANLAARSIPIRGFVLAVVALILLTGPVAAQSPGEAFCNTDMVQTVQNIFTFIQFGGPLLGGVLALGATVMLPFVRRADWKKEMKETRNQGLLWGVIVAPLGTQILAFILNNVVAGGGACGF